MKELEASILVRFTAALALVAAFAGCQAWQSSTGIPVIGSSKGERQIVKQAKNDPFPSPDQVGLEVLR